MRRLRNCALALLLGCCAPVLIWTGAGVALFQSRKGMKRSIQAYANMVCKMDTDCPQGYICFNGRCVPEAEAR